MLTNSCQQDPPTVERTQPRIKYIYPDGTHCYRALHTTHAVFRNDAGALIARAEKPDGALYEFEIKAFELLEPGIVYD